MHSKKANPVRDNGDCHVGNRISNGANLSKDRDAKPTA